MDFGTLPRTMRKSWKVSTVWMVALSPGMKPTPLTTSIQIGRVGGLTMQTFLNGHLVHNMARIDTIKDEKMLGHSKGGLDIKTQ